MKRHLWKSIAVVAALLLLPATAAFAQQIDVVEADVPFAFVVNETHFEPGKVVLEQFADKTSSEVVIYRQDDPETREVFLVEKISGDVPADETELVFDEVAGTTFLSEVWIARDTGLRVAHAEPDKRVTGSLSQRQATEKDKSMMASTY